MKKIVITSLSFGVVLAVSAQKELRPANPPKPSIPPIERLVEIPPVPEVPPPPPPPAFFEENNVPTDHKLFLKRNPSVRSVGWSKETIIIRLKSGEQERYNIADEKSLKVAEKKYGSLPVAPPPPPPTPARTKK
jgi:hypothetical protein